LIPLAILAGYVAGVVVILVELAAERSGIEVGSYALSGNGALIVPFILVPFALYPGWTWLLAHGENRRLEAALYTLGLHFGVGMGGVLSALVNPQSSGVTAASLAPGILLSGAFFVLPAALVAATTLWLIRSGRLGVTPLTAGFGIVIAALTSLLLGAGLGILSGGAVALGLERPTDRVTIGIVLLVLVIVCGNAPFIPTMLTPLPQ
jgi:hypothetical protein